MSEYLTRRLEAVEKQNALLKAAIKETWGFVKYHLPLSLELEVQAQPTLKTIEYNRKAFQPLLDLVLNTSVEVMQETNRPFHYKTAVDLILNRAEDDEKLKKLLARYSEPNLAGKVRDLATMKWLVRVGKGMYFYGPKLAEKRMTFYAKQGEAQPK
jgi:hypothetical protein